MKIQVHIRDNKKDIKEIVEAPSLDVALDEMTKKYPNGRVTLLRKLDQR